MTSPARITRAQLLEAVRILGLDPDKVDRITIEPDYVWATTAPGKSPICIKVVDQ